MSEIKFDSRSTELKLQHISNVKESDKGYPDGFKLQQPKDHTVPVVPVSVNKMFKYVQVGEAEEGSFSDAKFPGLFTAGVTGSAAAVLVIFSPENENPAHYFFLHAAGTGDLRNNAALQKALMREANAQFVVMVNGDGSAADRILDAYITTLRQISAIHIDGNSVIDGNKLPVADVNNIGEADADEMRGGDIGGLSGGASGEMLTDDVGKMFDDAGKLISNDISEMMDDAGKLLGVPAKKSDRAVSGTSNIFAWSTRWDTFCVTLSADYHSLPCGSFGHYLPDPAGQVKGQGVDEPVNTSQAFGENFFHESLRDFTAADLKSLMEKVKSIGNK